MATYLELVQQLARESGTVPGTQPLTLSGDQPARLQKMSYWVDQAWTQIQLHKAYWHWMRAEFTAETAPGVASYSPVSLGITRFARFVEQYGTMRIYDPALGIDDEQFLRPQNFWYWRRLYGIRIQQQSRPWCFSISEPYQMLHLGPVPDLHYVLIGEYFKSPQKLVVDTDIPEMPERYHNMIVWKALLLLAGHDEGQFAVGNAAAQYREYLGELERDQLPSLEMARPYWR